MLTLPGDLEPPDSKNICVRYSGVLKCKALWVMQAFFSCILPPNGSQVRHFSSGVIWCFLLEPVKSLAA